MESEKRFSLYEDHFISIINKRLTVDLKNHNWLTTKILNNDFKHKDREKERLVPLQEADLPNNYRSKKMTVAFLRIKLRIKRKVLAQTPDGVLSAWNVKKKIQILESTGSTASRSRPQSLKKLRSHTTRFEAFIWTPRHTAA
ncbi:hypothetical protein HW555_000933 [Spodoptera exigua]|uniref:Uncharacterized protein n=1 Tax=Spodoptera exigua TaxID=7107 RepID=A0A835GQZ3_SPOEX|nr:hypothetical protein HW555_000933 [Spodoptera exigua]